MKSDQPLESQGVGAEKEAGGQLEDEPIFGGGDIRDISDPL